MQKPSGEFANQPETKRGFSSSTCLCDQLTIMSWHPAGGNDPFPKSTLTLFLSTLMLGRLSQDSAVISGGSVLTPLLSGHPVDCILIKNMQLELWRDAGVSFALVRPHYRLPGSKSILISCCRAKVYRATRVRALRDLGHIRPTAEV